MRDIYAIGDLQGCQTSFEQLLARLPQDADLWLAGDLVNRGPRSLDTLRQVIALGDRATAVLGNHDLHLLAVAAGVRQAHGSDTLDDILTAPDRDTLIDWVRRQPLAHFARGSADPPRGRDRDYGLGHGPVHRQDRHADRKPHAGGACRSGWNGVAARRYAPAR